VDLEKDVDLIEKNISIIIPTKNAGPDFDFTLEKIRTQKGIKEPEIIIVDTGSTDETVKLAEKYGATVYRIKPEEFNHGLTRNYGAEKVTGDYILFMVQDAIPIGNYWLYKMVKVLESDTKIAAASCRQVPRSDADLFASYTMWYHYRVMEFNNDKIVSTNKENFKKLTEIEKRRGYRVRNKAY
jgi:glycosyltransferase involved in cell wall biosynthesis